MVMRWLTCGTNSVHIVGTCPDCYATQGGLLLGTAATGFSGKITAKCVDCGKTIDYYIDASQERIWRLDPVESRGVKVD